MRYAVFTVILPELDLDETIEALADNGYDGVEWRCRKIPEERGGEPYSFWGNVKNDMPPQRLIKEGALIAEKCRDAGLEPFAVASYCNCYEHDEVKLCAEATASLGAKYFRVGPPHYDGSINYNRLYGEALENYAKAIEIARGFSVSVAIETHMGNICCSASLTYRIVSEFPPEDIGVIYDPGNMVHEGYEPYQLGLELLSPYLRHVHVKNQCWKETGRRENGSADWRAGNCPFLEGVVNWEEVIRALRKVGFDGYLSFEDFSDTPWQRKLSGNLAFLKGVEKGLKADG